MTLSREDANGLAVSVGVHVVLAILLFATTLEPPLQRPEYIELSLGTITTASLSREPAARRVPPARAERSTVPQQRTLDLPERTFNSGDDVFRSATARKLDVADHPRTLAGDVRHADSGIIDRSADSEERKTATMGSDRADIAHPGAGEAGGAETGSAVSYAMQWTGGGTRKKISGALPEYPRGENSEAQIKIEAVVLPDGTIQSTKPAQKGNTRLEEAAMKEVRLWRFERLGPSLPQRTQTCIISFDFRLR